MKRAVYFCKLGFMFFTLPWIIRISTASFLSYDGASRTQVFDLADDALAIVGAGVNDAKEREKKIFVNFDGAPGCSTHGEWGEVNVLVEGLLELMVACRGVAG